MRPPGHTFGRTLSTKIFGYEAIRTKAKAYFLTPLDPLEVESFLSAFRAKPHGNGRLNGAVPTEKKKKTLPEMLITPTADGANLTPFKEILYLKAAGGYTDIYLQNGKRITVSGRLKLLEKRLPRETFIRLHRSFMVNLYFVREFSRRDGLFVMLKNEEIIPFRGLIRKNFWHS